MDERRTRLLRGPSGPTSAASRSDLHAAFAEAYEAARERLGPDRQDDLGEAVLKWWRYTSTEVPDYLIVDGTVSVGFLVYWLSKTANEIRARAQQREQRKVDHGFVVIRDADDEGNPLSLYDRTAVPVEDAAVDGIEARATLSRLGGFEAIDLVTRCRALGLSYEEIAERLAITSGNARVRNHRARARLVARYEEAA
jgi:hypothetical protein